MYSFSFSIATLGLTLVLSALAHAQSPTPGTTTVGEQESLLKVEDFSPRKGRWSINYGLSYQSVDKGGYIPSLLFVPDANGTIFAVPSISPSTDRVDEGSLNIGARYALTGNVNLFGQVSGSLSNVRTTTALGVSENKTSFGLGALNLGADFRFTPNISRTNFTGFVFVSAAEQADTDWIFGTALSAGFTASRIIDPLILSATVNYNHFFPRTTTSGRHNPGNVITFTPTIGFAVNPDINLSWGMGFSYRTGDELAGAPKGSSDVLTTVNLGLGYRLTKDKLLNINGRAGVGGNDAVQIDASISQRF